MTMMIMMVLLCMYCIIWSGVRDETRMKACNVSYRNHKIATLDGHYYI